MKRALLAFLTLFALGIPLTAQAGHWVTKEIKWQYSTVGTPTDPTGIYVRDSLYNAVGGGASNAGDTTAVFSLDNATVPPRGGGGVGGGLSQSAGLNQSDSTVVAWVLLQSDSSVATTATATSVTMIIDGRIGGFGPTTTTLAGLGEGWVKADSSFINGAAGGTMATGNDAYGLPIHTITPYGNILRWPQFRARVSCATGSIPAARVYLRYYATDD